MTVADRDPAAVERVGAELAHVQACVLDVGDADALAAELEGRWAVIDAGPFDIGMRIAAAAVVLICTTLVFLVGFALLSRKRDEEAA